VKNEPFARLAAAVSLVVRPQIADRPMDLAQAVLCVTPGPIDVPGTAGPMGPHLNSGAARLPGVIFFEHETSLCSSSHVAQMPPL
jgi:hypothetical protein